MYILCHFRNKCYRILSYLILLPNNTCYKYITLSQRLYGECIQYGYNNELTPYISASEDSKGTMHMPISNC